MRADQIGLSMKIVCIEHRNTLCRVSKTMYRKAIMIIIMLLRKNISQKLKLVTKILLSDLKALLYVVQFVSATLYLTYVAQKLLYTAIKLFAMQCEATKHTTATAYGGTYLKWTTHPSSSGDLQHTEKVCLHISRTLNIVAAKTIRCMWIVKLQKNVTYTRTHLIQLSCNIAKIYHV